MGRHRVRVGVLAMLILCAGVIGTGAGQDDAEAEAVRLAIRTLSEHLAVDEETITLDEVMAVDWRDASLGCPEPGRSDAQIIMSGFRVTLAVAIHRVHVAGTRAVVCEQPAASRNQGPIPDRGLLR